MLTSCKTYCYYSLGCCICLPKTGLYFPFSATASLCETDEVTVRTAAAEGERVGSVVLLGEASFLSNLDLIKRKQSRLLKMTLYRQLFTFPFMLCFLV